MATIHFIAAIDKASNKVLGYLCEEMIGNIRLGKYEDMIKDEYYWRDDYRARQGVVECAKYWAKKFPSMNFEVRHSQIA